MKKTVFIVVVFLITLSQAFTDENFGFFLDNDFRRNLEIFNIDKVRLDNFLLKADRIENHGDDSQYIDFIGNVCGIEEEKNIMFLSDRLRYDRKRKIILLEGNSTFEDKEKELVAKSNFIEYDFREDIAVFKKQVRFFMDDMVCRSEFAVYRRIENLLDISEFPVVFEKDNEYRADRIRIDLETGDVAMESRLPGTIRN